ncbi:dihydrofolate reductase family protein [Patulibacter sp.]|uniref:dihydrofolate reductase family protein n=1 Tax=Patulibacter sp. TaxID=1912859 RepID=UPI002717B732|nr:dihydrofolate reductase family protein [Patulibacter sp.]MDO9409673.1 dihydrofolate reductase family protein [Patulibacter sp.]
MSTPAFRSLDPGPELGTDDLIDAVVADASSPATRDAAGRPRTIGVMVQSTDGHVTVEGRSGGLGGPEDRAVFRGLRARADALLVGAGTLNGERYSTTLDEPHRTARRSAGLAPEPVLATISRSFSLDEDLPLLHEDLTRAVVYTETEPPFAVDAERIEVVRLEDASPAAALRDLHDRGVGTVNCEGGPGLLAALVRDGLLDELLVTVSPLLVGGESALTMLRGDLGPGPPRDLTLRGTWRGGDVLFLHYHLNPGSPA